MTDFSTFDNRYLISAIMRLEKPMHVGRGISLEPIGTDLPVAIDQQRNPFIPGSSVKGVLRSEIERILRTLEAQQKKIEGNKISVCDVSEPCPKMEKEERRDLISRCTPEEFAQEIFSRLCTVCGLFGCGDLASHVMIKDMSLCSEKTRTEIRDGVSIDRDTGTARQGQLFNFEIVPVGTEFTFEAVLENVKDWQVGLFGIVLKLWERGEIAVGGKTSIGMGFGILKDMSIRKVDTRNLIDYVLTGEAEETEIEQYIEIFRAKLEG